MPRFESNVGDIEGHGPASADPPIAPSSRAFRRRHDGRVERSGFEARLGVRRLLRILSRPLHGRVFRSAARRLPRARALAVARRVHRDVQQERRRAAARGPPEPEPRRRRRIPPRRGQLQPRARPPGRCRAPRVHRRVGHVHARLRRERGGRLLRRQHRLRGRHDPPPRRVAPHPAADPLVPAPRLRPAPPHPARPRRRARRRARGEPPHSRGRGPGRAGSPRQPPAPLRRLRGTRPSGRASPRRRSRRSQRPQQHGRDPDAQRRVARPSRVPLVSRLCRRRRQRGGRGRRLAASPRDRTPRHRSPPQGGCGP